MKKKNKYFFVDACHMKRPIDDQIHRFLVSANEHFSKNNVPEDYRKFIIKVTNNSSCEEFVTRTRFNHTGVDKYSLSINDNGVYATTGKMKDKSKDPYGYERYKGLSFLEDVKFIDELHVINFLKELKKENIYEKYLKSILDFIRETNMILSNIETDEMIDNFDIQSLKLKK